MASERTHRTNSRVGKEKKHKRGGTAQRNLLARWKQYMTCWEKKVRASQPTSAAIWAVPDPPAEQRLRWSSRYVRKKAVGLNTCTDRVYHRIASNQHAPNMDTKNMVYEVRGAMKRGECGQNLAQIWNTGRSG